MEKIKKLIVLMMVLTVVFACAGCANKNIDNVITTPDESDRIPSDATGDTTAADGDLVIETEEIGEIQTELEDSELDNIDKELGDIDW